MKIIKENSAHLDAVLYIGTCRHCQSVVQFDACETCWNSENHISLEDCPVCGLEEIEVEVKL